MSEPSRPPRSRRALAVMIAAPLLALVALLSWGASSPVGSSPDDEFHLASIWCGHGENANGCSASDIGPEYRDVRSDVQVTAVCFAYDGNKSAACQGDAFGQDPDTRNVTDRTNAGGLYPPLFYLAMSPFAGHDLEPSVFAMRVANSVLFVGVVTALFFLLPLQRRGTLLWALVLTVIPLGLSIIPSTNPSSWAILSAGTLWISLLGYFETTGRRRIALGAMAVLSTVLGAGARSDSALYAGLAIVIVVGLTARRSRAYLLAAILPAALMALAVAFYFSGGQSAAAIGGLAAPDDIPDTSPFVLFAANIVSVPSLWAGIFGSWNIGWLDTVLPASVWVAALGCFCGAAFLGLAARVPRKGIAVGLVLAALFLVPTAILVQSQSVVGAYVQPRYILPLMILLAGFLLLHQSGRGIPFTNLHGWIVVVALSLANAVALHTNIRRYVTGADSFGVDLDDGREWWWPVAITPVAVWIIGSIAFAAFLVLVRPRLAISRSTT